MLERMSTTAASSPDRLPRRDLVILPAISFLTIISLLMGSEVVARYFFPLSDKDVCMVGDAKIGLRFLPNCTASLKAFEGPWITNSYNECGYRTKESCGPKRAGSIRISLLGSSASEGLWVSYDQTFYVRAARDLTRMCGRPVEVQSLGRQGCYPLCSFRRIDEALSLKPDVVVMTITPWDLEKLVPSEIPNRYKPIPPPRASDSARANISLLQATWNMARDSRGLLVAQHFLYQDPSTYVRIALLHGDGEDFLRTPFSRAWTERLDGFDRLAGEMAEKSQAANVPFVLVEVPSVSQAQLLASVPPPSKIDPNALNERLAQISSRHGIRFVNPLDTFRRTPGSDKMFYMVDGHVNGDGQALISDTLVEQLIQGSSPVLTGCAVAGGSL
jgi:hypothetical protein